MSEFKKALKEAGFGARDLGGNGESDPIKKAHSRAKIWQYISKDWYREMDFGQHAQFCLDCNTAKAVEAFDIPRGENRGSYIVLLNGSYSKKDLIDIMVYHLILEAREGGF